MSTSQPDFEKLTERTLGGLKVSPAAKQMANLNILLYGNPGVGKTVLAASASAVEEMSPVLIIDIEGGTFSVRNKYPNVDVVRVGAWTDIQKVYDELYKGKTGYRTIILDSLSEIQKFGMMTIMRDLVRKEPDRDPDVPGMREWGKSSEQVRLLVRAFRDLPIHTIFTALAKHDKDARTGMNMTQVGLPGKLSLDILGFVDIVVYLYIKVRKDELTRFGLSSPTDSVSAKDRSGLLPTVLDSPSMQEIYNIVMNNNEEG